ncbi:MAG: IPT/TIG domain-containing protein [Parafilimonas sp.]
MRKNRLFFVLTVAVCTLCITACQKGISDNTSSTPVSDSIPVPPDNTPVIFSIFPSSAHAGDTITVKGKNLSADISQVQITINNKAATVLSVTADSILAIVPLNAGSGQVVVNINGYAYQGPEFNYGRTVIVTTIAGTGSVGTADGDGLSASFNCPWGITADVNGDLYVADCYNRLIRKISASDGSVSTFSIPTLVNGKNFYSPYNIALDVATHNLYVTDFNKHVMRMDPSGNATVIYEDNMALAGIAVSPDGQNLFISNNTTGTIIKTDIDGSNANVFTSGLITPRNIIFDNSGQMYVASYPSSVYAIGTNGSATPAVNDPSFQGWEIAKDTAGNFYLADHFSNVIRMIDRQGNVSVIAGGGNAEDIDGVGLQASFNGPQGLTIDSHGNLYVTTFNYTTNGGNKIRKITFE